MLVCRHCIQLRFPTQNDVFSTIYNSRKYTYNVEELNTNSFIFLPDFSSTQRCGCKYRYYVDKSKCVLFWLTYAWNWFVLFLRICPNCFNLSLTVRLDWHALCINGTPASNRHCSQRVRLLGEIYVKQFTPVFEIGLLSSECWKSERLLLIWFICLFRTRI